MAFRMLALGDSYTAGEGVRVHDRWPNQLARMLVDGGFPVELPRVVARTGWTTADLLEGLRQASILGFFDMVTLLIGVNNQYQGLPLADYEDEFRSLLRRMVRYVQGDPTRAVVLSIPDWGVTPFAVGQDRAAIAGQIDAFNASNEALTREAGLSYINLTALSRDLGWNPEMFVRDGLHPSPLQYNAWARLVLPEAHRLCRL
jgi:lysophospholipase L1-like esterase